MESRPDTTARAALATRAARLVPAALIPALALVMALGQAQYASTWYPAALGVCAAFILFSIAGPRRRLARLQVIALGAATAFAGWTYLSLAWSELGGATLTEANRAATYAIALALVVLVADTPERRRDLLVLAAGASAVLAIVVGVRLGIGGAVELFDGTRLFRPIGYPNTLAAFMLAGLWPLVALAASPDEPPALRAAALAGAAAIPAAALLTVSRAGAAFAVLATIVYFGVSPIRVRSLAAALVAFAPVAVGFDRLDAPQSAEVTEAVARAAGQVVLLGALGGAVVGLAWAILDRRHQLPSTIGRALRVLLAAAAVGGVIAAAVVAIDRDAAGFAERRWDAFRAGQGSDADESTNRLLTSGSNRYDFWRVAVEMVGERPITGYGAATWQWRYLEEAASSEEPDNAHGAIWEFAAGLGIVGAVLYVLAFGLALVAPFLPATTADATRSAAVLASLVGLLGHTQVDWLWESPSTGLLTTTFAGLALAGIRRPDGVPRGAVRTAALAGAIAVAVVGVIPALLAERYTDASYAAGAGGIADAERAAALNRFSAAPELARAAAARRAGDRVVEAAALGSATEREPKNWVAWFQLAAAQAAAGDTTAGARSCIQAQHIKPSLSCPGQSS